MDNIEFQGVRFPKNFILEKTSKIQYSIEVHHNTNLQCYEIDVQDLRNLNQKDRNLFQEVCTEIYLNGGIFILNRNSNVFPDISYNKNGWIDQLPVEATAYQKINYSLVNIERQMKSLDITNNEFYRGIYLDGFRYLHLTEEEIYLLRTEFQNNGFDIKYELTDSNKENIEIAEVEEQEKKYSIKNWWDDVIVKDFISLLPSNLGAIKRNLEEYKQQWIVELTSEDWRKILRSKGIGLKKRNDFINFSRQLTPEIFDKAKEENNSTKSCNEFQEILHEYPVLKDISISKLLEQIPNNKHTIRKNLYPLKEKQFSEVTNDEWNHYMNEKGMGKKAKEIVYESLNHLIIQLEEEWNTTILNILSRAKKKDILQFWQLNEEEILNQKIVREKLVEWRKRDIKIFPPFTLRKVLQILDSPINSNCQEEKRKKIINILDFSIKEIIEGDFELDENVLQVLLVIIALYTYLCGSNPEMIDIIGEFSKSLKENEQFIIKERFSGKTLEEVGQILDVTRERIRQIEAKSKKEIQEMMHQLRYYSLIHTLIEQNKIVHLSEIWIQWIDYLYKNQFITLNDCIFTQEFEEELAQFKEEFDYILNQEIVIEKDEFMNRLYNISAFENIDFEENEELFEFCLQYLSMRQINENYLAKKKTTRSEETYIIVKLYFKDGFTVSNTEQLQKFMRYYSQLFKNHQLFTWDENLQIVARRIEGNLERSKLEKISSRTYKYQTISLPDTFLEKVEKYIQNELQMYPVVYNKKLLMVFKEELKELLQEEYDDKTLKLYNLLKEKYHSIYSFSEGRVSRIFPKGQLLTTEEIFIEMIQRNHGSISQEKLCEDLGIEQYTIEQTINSSSIIRRNGHDLYIGQLPNELREKINHYIKQELEIYQFVTPIVIYHQLELEDATLLQQNHITKDSIASVCKEICPELKGHGQVLSYGIREEDTDSAFEYFRNYVGNEEIYLKENLLEVFSSIGYSPTTTMLKFKKLSEKNGIYQLDKDTFIYSDQLILSEEQKEVLQNFISSYLENKNFVSLVVDINSRKRKKLERQLDIPFSLTPSLLGHLLADQLNYDVLFAENLQFTNNPWIIVPRNTTTMKTLLIQELEKYQGDNKECDVVDYLIQQHLILENKQHTIPEYVCKLLNITIDSYSKEVIWNGRD